MKKMDVYPVFRRRGTTVPVGATHGGSRRVTRQQEGAELLSRTCIVVSVGRMGKAW